MFVALSQTDMLNLRCMLLVSSFCGIGYNLLQPKPLIAPATWGCAFLSIHIYMIIVLLRERKEETLSKEEEEVYASAFSPYGFTCRQFLDLLEGATPRWCTFSRGDRIVRLGDEMAELHYIFQGEGELVSTTNDRLHPISPGKGGWIGEFFDPNIASDYWDKPHPWRCECRCMTEQCQTLAFPRKDLDSLLRSNPRLKEAATRAAVSDVWGKLFDTIGDMRRSAYKSMLQVALADGVVDVEERSMLEDFRRRHKISNEEEATFLEELGWNREEFVGGRRRSRTSH